METITAEEFQLDMCGWLQRVAAGETFLLTHAGKPVAEVTPVSDNAKLRPFGLCAGEFVVPDDFDDPLPEDLLAAFEGRGDEHSFPAA